MRCSAMSGIRAVSLRVGTGPQLGALDDGEVGAGDHAEGGADQEGRGEAEAAGDRDDGAAGWQVLGSGLEIPGQKP